MLDEDGPFVTYADHVEALRQASALATPETVAQAMYWYEQGQRDVFAYHPEWTVTDMCKPDCLPCQRLTELITEREKGYEEGQRDALAAAVQRVQAHLIMLDGNGWRATLNGEGYSDLAGFGPGVIAAVKGGQP
jgi:hypothetical protein